MRAITIGWHIGLIPLYLTAITQGLNNLIAADDLSKRF